MENRPLKRSLSLAGFPVVPRRKRSAFVAPRPPLDHVTSHDAQSEETNQKPKREKKPLLKPPIMKLYPMPDAVRRKIRQIGGGRIILDIQKQLSYTDVKPVNSRLSIPRNQLIFPFLSKEEETALAGDDDGGQRKPGIKVLVLDPRLEETQLIFKKWTMDKTCVYNLTQNWNGLVKENGLEAGDTVQVWSFRKGSDLCFALIKLNEEGGVDNRSSPAEASTAVKVKEEPEG